MIHFQGGGGVGEEGGLGQPFEKGSILKGKKLLPMVANILKGKKLLPMVANYFHYFPFKLVKRGTMHRKVNMR